MTTYENGHTTNSGGRGEDGDHRREDEGEDEHDHEHDHEDDYDDDHDREGGASGVRDQRPSEEALRRHREACRSGAFGYEDPKSGLFVMTSVYLREQGRCCGSGCRHCPWPVDEQRRAGRPPSAPAWPWDETDS